MPTNEKAKKGNGVPKIEKKKEVVPAESEETKAEPGAAPQQLDREELEALRKKLQRKFH